MPEQLTKHPEVTLQVLRSAGARCGEGAAQEILTRCAPERFCKLPGGELCVFGLDEASRMTQISAGEWRALAPATPSEAPPAPASLTADLWLGGGVGLLAGAALGVAAARWRRHKASWKDRD